MSLKKPKKFLYIIHTFPPMISPGSIRAFELSKRLIKENINPIILTRQILKQSNKDFGFVKKIPSLLKIHRTPVILTPDSAIKSFLHWIPHAYIRGVSIIKRENDINFIYATLPSFYSLIIGYLFKQRFKIPLIIEYRDPWNYNPYTINKKRSILSKLNIAIEKKVLNSADLIITVSNELKSLLISKFSQVKNKPIHILESGLNLIQSLEPQNIEREEIIFTFTGLLYDKRSIMPLLKIISMLNSESFFENIKFKIKIFGKYDKISINNFLIENNISNIVFLGGFISYEKVLSEIKKANLALHIGEDLNYPTLSFKVWEYLSLNKKIVYLGREDSYTSKFLLNNNFGIIISIDNLLKGKKTLKSLLVRIKENNYNCNIKKNDIEKYTWDNRVDKLKKIIEKYF